MQFSSWMGQVSKSSYFVSADNVLMTTITKFKPQVYHTVRRRSRRMFSTHFEIFRRFDGVVIYFFNSDFKFFDDASEFSVTSFYVVSVFS